MITSSIVSVIGRSGGIGRRDFPPNEECGGRLACEFGYRRDHHPQWLGHAGLNTTNLNAQAIGMCKTRMAPAAAGRLWSSTPTDNEFTLAKGTNNGVSDAAPRDQPDLAGNRHSMYYTHV